MFKCTGDAGDWSITSGLAMTVTPIGAQGGPLGFRVTMNVETAKCMFLRIVPWAVSFWRARVPTHRGGRGRPPFRMRHERETARQDASPPEKEAALFEGAASSRTRKKESGRRERIRRWGEASPPRRVEGEERGKRFAGTARPTVKTPEGGAGRKIRAVFEIL